VSCLTLALTPAAWANSSISLPPSPQGPGGEDAIETTEGARCRQSINSNGPYLDAGAAGHTSTPLKDSPIAGPLFYSEDRDSEALAYVRITIPLGKRPQRIDCSRLYELEIARMKREIDVLKMAAE
jgi:hypothetical protein